MIGLGSNLSSTVTRDDGRFVRPAHPASRSWRPSKRAFPCEAIDAQITFEVDAGGHTTRPTLLISEATDRPKDRGLADENAS